MCACVRFKTIHKYCLCFKHTTHTQNTQMTTRIVTTVNGHLPLHVLISCCVVRHFCDVTKPTYTQKYFPFSQRKYFPFSQLKKTPTIKYCNCNEPPLRPHCISYDKHSQLHPQYVSFSIRCRNFIQIMFIVRRNPIEIITQ